jgi:hypothetical protein
VSACSCRVREGAAAPKAARPGARPEAAGILALQGVVGNHAVVQMMSCAGDEYQRPNALGPLRTLAFGLQAHAGNAAVTASVGGHAGGGPAAGGHAATDGRASPFVQRQPKPKPKAEDQPAWITAAQADLRQLFPDDKLMGHVIIKDYSKLNDTLKEEDYGAWTQSKTEIFLRDPASKGLPASVVKYELHHEAVHVRQFARDGGPPKTWQKMLEYEQEAYKSDTVWLAGSDAKKLIPEEDLLKQLQDGAAENLGKVNTLLDDTKKLSGKKREDELFKRMRSRDVDMIPEQAKADPTLLYKQPK